MSDFNTMRAAHDNKANVRKALGAAVFLAPVDETPIETLVGVDKTLIDIPETWLALGMFSEDGLSFEKSVDSEVVNALGYRTEVRRDYTTEEHTVALTALEIDRKVIAEIVDGVDLTDVEADVNGEIAYDVPEIEAARQYRLLAISKDINKTNGKEIYRGRCYRSVEVLEFPSEAWGADAISYELSFTARADEDGVVFRRFTAGPGLDPTDIGFTVGTGA